MRTVFVSLIAVMLVTACSADDTEPKTVDAATLAPLSGRERSLILAAESATRQDNIAAAEKDYQSAIEASTGHVEAHVALAQLYLRQQQPAKAQPVLEKAISLQPNNPGANYLLGKLALNNGDAEAALIRFTKGLSAQPDDLDLVNGAAIAHDMLGQHAAAQALYVPAIANHKTRNLTALRTNLAMSYLLSGKTMQALPLLQEEAKKSSASSVIRYNLALTYAMMGNTAAVKKFVRAGGNESALMITAARLKAYLADSSPVKKPPTLAP